MKRFLVWKTGGFKAHTNGRNIVGQQHATLIVGLNMCVRCLRTTMFASWKCLRMRIARITVYVPECIASSYDHQQCWQLLRSLACTTQQVPTSANNSQHCWDNNAVTCCDRLHGRTLCFMESMVVTTEKNVIVGCLVTYEALLHLIPTHSRVKNPPDNFTLLKYSSSLSVK